MFVKDQAKNVILLYMEIWSHMTDVDTIEIAYNIRIFIQLSAKQQSIYNRVVRQNVTPNEQEPERPQINNLNTVQLPVADIKAKKTEQRLC